MVTPDLCLIEQLFYIVLRLVKTRVSPSEVSRKSMKFRRPGIAHVDITERNAVEGRGSRPARSSVKK